MQNGGTMFFKDQSSYQRSTKRILAACCLAACLSQTQGCGTERLERVVSVKGEKGDQGEPGIDGMDGMNGRDGKDAPQQPQQQEPRPEVEYKPYPVPYPKPEPYPMPYPRPEPYPMPYPQPQQPPQRLFTVCVCLPQNNDSQNCWWPKPQEPQKPACLYTTMELLQDELLRYQIVHHGPCRERN